MERVSDVPAVVGFQAKPNIGLLVPPGRSILVFSSPALFLIET